MATKRLVVNVISMILRSAAVHKNHAALAQTKIHIPIVVGWLRKEFNGKRYLRVSPASMSEFQKRLVLSYLLRFKTRTNLHVELLYVQRVFGAKALRS